VSFDAALTLGILGVAVVLFVSERIRADLVGLMILFILVAAGIVTPEEGISGFANPAVVTVWAVFILSAGLARTGVSTVLGEKVLRLAGKGETRLLAVLMTSTAALSAFMNNIGVAAMFLPVTKDIARRTGRAPSRLLLPMAYGSLLGGMLTLIGTASNLVVSDFLHEAGMPPLGLFDFAPIGLVVLVAAVGNTLLVGRRTLPENSPASTTSDSSARRGRGPRQHYGLEERLATLRLPDGSPLAGLTLEESRLGRGLGLNVMSVVRQETTHHLPTPDFVLQAGDRLVVLGRVETMTELGGHPTLTVEAKAPAITFLTSPGIGIAELEVQPASPLLGTTVAEAEVRRRQGINVLALRRGDEIRRANVSEAVLEQGDRLLIQGAEGTLQQLAGTPGFRRLSAREAEQWAIADHLLLLRVAAGSGLAGCTVAESRLAAGYGILVLGVGQHGENWRLATPDLRLQEDDVLLVQGKPLDLDLLHGHRTLVVERTDEMDLSQLENRELAMAEVMLSPYTSLAGKTLRQLHFREKYGLQVLAIWRGHRPYRSRLSDVALSFGDALLCWGRREMLTLLAQDRDFVVLDVATQEPARVEKAPVAAMIMIGVVAVVLAGWLPISVAALGGATFMVLSRCLSMEEAYRAIEWNGVFLIATMLPLGLAMQRTGAAALLATTVVDATGPWGPIAILAGIMALTLVINQFIPSAVNAVVMTPIALATAAELQLSPYPFVMAVAYAAAASFMTPVSHPVNILVMSPGGYRFTDYLKNGLGLSLIVLVICIALLPFVFPF
jgi:di/tricarboxylate transporter